MAKSKTELTSVQLTALLPSFLKRVGGLYRSAPQLVMQAWPTAVGPSLAPLTRAISFVDGVLIVGVRNSTLFSLLSQHDKPRILQNLRTKFPHVTIKSLVFRLE